MFRLGYNTNGLPHHRVPEALQLLAELGYGGVAITPDAGLLDPMDLDPDDVARVRLVAEELGLDLVVETGARYLLDPLHKHRPNLLDPEPSGRARRIDFLLRSVDLAADLGARVVSLWAGAAPDGSVGDGERPGAGAEIHWSHLLDGLCEVLDRANAQGVAIAFEPEPGMFLERPSGYLELLDRLGERRGDPTELGLALDVGHLVVTGDLPVGEVIRELGPHIATVHLDDARRGDHVHRMFGEGELDLAETLGALLDTGFDGLASVELSRDGHRGPEAAREAMEHLEKALVDALP
ncbi:MAG TPA: sugar phosphate isomerase/epimerase [Planctomycetes bacterium]|nr:sugar phosphate isomerase/epimerase [Planctomycetota bacterium]